MTPEEAREILPVVQARMEGKLVQVKDYRAKDYQGVWKDSLGPTWHPSKFRVKPEPRRVWRLYHDSEEPLTFKTEAEAVRRWLDFGGRGEAPVEFVEVVKPTTTEKERQE